MSFESFLLGFEGALWYLAIGLLISGGILVLLSVVLNLESFAHALGLGEKDLVTHDFGEGDHDISVADHDVGVMDHDVSGVDHGISIIDHDIGAVDHDVGVVDHDVGMIDHDIDVGDHDIGVADHDITADTDVSEVHLDSLKDTTHTSAPIFLLLSTYFLMFGILGVSTLRIESASAGIRIFRILVIIISPFLLALVITNIWKRISKTTTKPLIRGVQLIGKEAIVYVSVDNRGGTIHVDLGEGFGTQKLPAKSFDYYKKFERDERVRIVAVKNRIYIVDTI